MKHKSKIAILLQDVLEFVQGLANQRADPSYHGRRDWHRYSQAISSRKFDPTTLERLNRNIERILSFYDQIDPDGDYHSDEGEVDFLSRSAADERDRRASEVQDAANNALGILKSMLASLPENTEAEKGQQDSDILTVRQAAGVLKVSERQIRRYVQDGKLMATNVGQGTHHKRYRIQKADVEALLNNGETCPNMSSPTPAPPPAASAPPQLPADMPDYFA